MFGFGAAAAVEADPRAAGAELRRALGVDWNNFEPNSRCRRARSSRRRTSRRSRQAFRDTLARSLKDGFAQKELDEARSGLLSLRRLSRAQDEVLAAQLAGNLYLGRDFLLAQRIDDAISKLTLEQVNAAWRRYIDPSRVVFAWAGDFKP
jgi:zinc protease